MATLNFQDYSKYFIPTRDGVLVDTEIFQHREEIGAKFWDLLSLWSGCGDEEALLRFEHKIDNCFLTRREFNAVRNRLFLALVQRDGGMCVTCGTNEDLTIDHVTPISKGGTNDLENLQILCRTHNSQKGAK